MFVSACLCPPLAGKSTSCAVTVSFGSEDVPVETGCHILSFKFFFIVLLPFIIGHDATKDVSFLMFAKCSSFEEGNCYDSTKRNINSCADVMKKYLLFNCMF